MPGERFQALSRLPLAGFRAAEYQQQQQSCSEGLQEAARIAARGAQSQHSQQHRMLGGGRCAWSLPSWKHSLDEIVST
jgi:hypothetical protein